MNANTLWVALLITGFVVFAVFACIAVRNDDEREIREWASANGYTVISLDEKFLDYGPFWYKGKHQRMYRAELEDRNGQRRISYFRKGWGTEQAWYDRE